MVTGGCDGVVRLRCRKDGSLISSLTDTKGIAIVGLYIINDNLYFAARNGVVKKIIIENKTMRIDPKYELKHDDCITDISVDNNKILGKELFK